MNHSKQQKTLPCLIGEDSDFSDPIITNSLHNFSEIVVSVEILGFSVSLNRQWNICPKQ